MSTTQASAGWVPSEGCEGGSVSRLSPAPGGLLTVLRTLWLIDSSPRSAPAPALVPCLLTQSPLCVCLGLCPHFPSNKDTVISD